MSPVTRSVEPWIAIPLPPKRVPGLGEMRGSWRPRVAHSETHKDAARSINRARTLARPRCHHGSRPVIIYITGAKNMYKNSKVEDKLRLVIT